MSNHKIFNTAIYCRLSQEDRHKLNDDESQSIQNQKSFLTQYVIQNGFSLFDVYVDDGYSGTNFERPDFQRLLLDIEAKKVNCVITKDMSRLGRDYIMTGHYLERYFPQHEVRYIAVNDGVDTFEDNSNNDMSPFRSVINDMYAKDISKKVRTALNTKKANGLFIGSVAPYGYKKDPMYKGHLIIDDETALIVKHIYSMFILGKAKLGIANTLSMEKVPTPSESKNLTFTQKRHKGIWNEVIINRILTNPTYAGHLTQNRVKTLNYKVKAKKNLPPNQWIIIKNTHQAIISQEDFDMVQMINMKRTYKQVEGKPHLLSGLLKCSSCHASMTYSKSSGNTYIVCSTWRKHGKLNLCTSHSIREDFVENQVIAELRFQAQEYVNRKLLLEKSIKPNDICTDMNKNIKSLNNRLEQIKENILNLYVDKTRGILNEIDFMNISAKFNTERENIHIQLENISEELEQRENIENNEESMKKLLEDFLNFENVDRNTLVLLIQKIEILDNKQIKIYFNFHL